MPRSRAPARLLHLSSKYSRRRRPEAFAGADAPDRERPLTRLRPGGRPPASPGVGSRSGPRCGDRLGQDPGPGRRSCGAPRLSRCRPGSTGAPWRERVRSARSAGRVRAPVAPRAARLRPYRPRFGPFLPPRRHSCPYGERSGVPCPGGRPAWYGQRALGRVCGPLRARMPRDFGSVSGLSSRPWWRASREGRFRRPRVRADRRRTGNPHRHSAPSPRSWLPVRTRQSRRSGIS